MIKITWIVTGSLAILTVLSSLFYLVQAGQGNATVTAMQRVELNSFQTTVLPVSFENEPQISTLTTLYPELSFVARGNDLTISATSPDDYRELFAAISSAIALFPTRRGWQLTGCIGEDCPTVPTFTLTANRLTPTQRAQ